MDSALVQNAWLIGALPLAAFAINGLWLGRVNWKAAAWLAVALNALAFLAVIRVAGAFYAEVLGDPGNHPLRTVIPWEVEWLSFSTGALGGFDLTAKMGVTLDPISVMMLLVVSFISTVVNVYSIGYMREDASAGRFFALLSLFTFSMQGLVAATNLVQMFVFWELVGVSSYLLIGFWYHKPSAVAASKKAFIITRFADSFFLMGILVVSYYVRSFDFTVVNAPGAAEALQGGVSFGPFEASLLTVATLLIFAGGWGKSAMFPLHVWLPDAMEGPTPVSSIIHSATMVVAGVFLTARMFPLFAASATTLQVIEFIGAFTALFAAVIACTQADIKRILAFSTLSQLGYMLFSLGAAKVSGNHGAEVNPLGYTASMFHVFTHAFFKCMLFLVAGQVIHAVHTNDIWKMGGLRRRLPIAYWATWVGCLAIAGIFPFSGFFSKDAIILTALQSGHWLTFGVGLFTGGLTALYMFRLLFVTFHGQARSKTPAVHENSFMAAPIALLAVPSAVAGWLAAGLFGRAVLPPMEPESGHFTHPAWLPYLATAVGLAGLGTAWKLYAAGDFSLAERVRGALGSAYSLVQNKFYLDEAYLKLVHGFLFPYVAAPVKWFDRHIVDGAMNFTGGFLRVGGAMVRILQVGQLQFYLAVTVVGIGVLVWMGAF